jgi:hypothetical protein
VKVITKEVLGQIAKVYTHLAGVSFLIYEVRSYILDKRLRTRCTSPLQLDCAFSDEVARLVASDDTEKADRKLETVDNRLFGSFELGGPEVIAAVIAGKA